MTSKEPEIMNEAEEDSDASVTIDDLCEDLESLYWFLVALIDVFLFFLF